MAGPSIVVRVLGDLKNLEQAFTSSGKKASSAASTIHGAFSSMLGTLNRAGLLGPFGESLSAVDESLDKISEHGKTIGKVMLGVGGALTGVGLGLQAIGSKDQAAHQQLQAAVEATGKSYDDYEKKIEAAIKHQERFGNTANQTQDALRVLTQATGDPTKALQLLNTATDLAAAKHEDLGTAATQLGKVYNGNAKLLKEFGITVTKAGNIQKGLTTATKQAQAADKALASAKQHLADIEALDAGKKKLTVAEAIRLRDAQQKVKDATQTAVGAHQRLAAATEAAKNATKNQGSAVTELSAKLHGQAAAAADTFACHMNAIKARVEDAAATFGQKYGPAITAAGAATTLAGGAMETASAISKTFKKVTEASTTATEAATAATDAATVSEGLALGPILLIIAAIGALVVAAYLIYRNWNTIWKAMKAVVLDVWNWIKTNWPLLLSILLGPITAAAYQIYRHWGEITAGAAAVLRWFATTWGTVTGYITAPFVSAWQAIARVWDGVIGWFSRLPGQISRLASGMWDGILGAFRGMVNGIIDIWNGLHFQLPKINAGPIHIGGETIGVPHIPHLDQGGLITRSGIVYAHAGEAISPAPGRTGPAVIINDAHFSSDVDIETFMRKTAWYVQTARI